MKYSNNKDINKLIKELLKLEQVSVKKGKKHHFLMKGSNKLSIPSTPSDRNSIRQFKRDIQKYL